MISHSTVPSILILNMTLVISNYGKRMYVDILKFGFKEQREKKKYSSPPKKKERTESKVEKLEIVKLRLFSKFI